MFAGLMTGILIIALLLFGTLNEFGGAIMLVIASITLLFFIIKKRRIRFFFNAGSILAIVFTTLYLISSSYALDRGMAFLGFIKILWIIPAMLCFSCLNKCEKDRVFDALPWFGVASTMIGVIGHHIESLRELFYASNRFGGFFFYANTQAIFLLMCIIWMCNKPKLRLADYIRYPVMLVGIAITGCRTAMILSVLVVVYLMIKNRNIRLILITIIAMALGAGAVFLLGDDAGVSRLAELSISESTFVGRLLYAYDAMPLIWTHPFGMGHLGYYYIQDSIQTGIYSVTYVHNDVIQIGLDIGIIPMILYVVVIAYSLFSKWLCHRKKLMLLVLFLHGMLDFDLSFGSMLLILIMILWDVKGPWKKVSDNALCVETDGAKMHMFVRVLLSVLCVGFMGMGVYFGIGLTAEYLGNEELAYEMYENNTRAKLALLSKVDDAQTAGMLADSILSQNRTCARAYYARALIADYTRDYDEMIRCGKLAIGNNYFRQKEYERYFGLLYDGLLSNDPKVYAQCAYEMNQVESYMDEAMGRLSFLGERINEQPNLHMTTDMIKTLEVINNTDYE